MKTGVLFSGYLVLMLITCCIVGSALGRVRESTVLYGLYETTINYKTLSGKSHQYSDPFYEVELESTFVSPSGRKISWWGFYDGDGEGGQSGDLWKIRFMPDEKGDWEYSWRFSDGSVSGSGSFQAVDNDSKPRKPGPLKHDAKIHQWIVSADGTRHVFMNMFQIVSDEDAWSNPQYHIDSAKENGFDILMIDGAVTGRRKPKDSKNPFQWMDTEEYVPRLQGWHYQEKGLFKKLYDQNIYLYDWAGFYAGNGWIKLHKKSISFQNKVIKYWLLRTAPYFFYIYNIGFELPEYADVPSWTEERAEFIKAIDPWDHLVTGHEVKGWSYAESPVIDFSALQNDGFDIKDRLKVVYRNIVNGSGNNHNSLRGISFHDIGLTVWNSKSEPHPHCDECIWNAKWQEPGTEESHRKDLWEGITGGMSYGFYAGDSTVGLSAFRNANAFLKSGVKWWTMSPHDELVEKGKAFVLANPGKEYIAYCPSGESFSLNMKEGRYNWRWFNPANGRYGNLNDVSHGGGSIAFHKPGEHDRVLYIRSHEEINFNTN